MNNQYKELEITEEEGKLICLKYDHNKKIDNIDVGDKVPLKDRFVCQQCIDLKVKAISILPIVQMKERISERKKEENQKKEQQKQNTIKILNLIYDELQKHQAKINQQLNDAQNYTQKWAETLKAIKQPDYFELVQGIQAYFEGNDSVKKINQEDIQYQINNQNIPFLYQNLEQLKNFEVFQQCIDKLTDIPKSEEKYLDQIRIKEINSIEHKLCQAMAFNSEGNIMVSGCETTINVYQFNQQNLNLSKKLNEHTGTVQCLSFSKKINWFFSGSSDSTIRGWKLESDEQWISSKPGQKHGYGVMCLILNKNEDQLISSSLDTTIKIWLVNGQTNSLHFNYSLEHGHTANVYQISLNLSENLLVSCSMDKKIILWGQDANNKWQNQCTFNDFQDYGYRISFINDDQIIWQQCHKGITHFFKVKDGKLILQPEMNLQLDFEKDDSCLFPTIVNTQKQIIVQKHFNSIYILKKQNDGNYKIASQPLNIGKSFQFGALTQNGKYLVVWMAEIAKLRIFNLEEN